ncbi:isopenicillin N synthase family dioxygenase [Chlorogloeopsis sp. ULAP02]|uniref:isopenicillin N synthase family dioxygenase n=1 Tax=Chlorogloeopsis sp. ULAP02 TaxID=3107926 RepID=UPI003136C577
MVNIPVINFSLFCNNNCIDRQIVVQQIYQACHEIGFMYLQNHGISIDLIKQIFLKSKDFFNLPLELKQRLAWSDEFSNQGYVGIERERLNANNPGDLKEAFNVGQKDAETRGRDDAENFYVSCLSSPAKDSSILDFYRACIELSNKILQALALALQLPEDFFTTRHTEQNHTLRLLHYPPVQKLPQPRQVRAGEHSDYGSITLLFQDEIGGLEIQTTAGQWIAAPVIPDTVIVNTGDLIQRWTNHVFCSTKHRVIIPSDQRVKQSRYSVAFFCHPNDNTEIACLESCQKEHPPIYPPILAGEYLLSRLRATY